MKILFILISATLVFLQIKMFGLSMEMLTFYMSIGKAYQGEAMFVILNISILFLIYRAFRNAMSLCKLK